MRTLPTLSAVLADWERELGSEFALARSFLRPTTAQSTDFPCTRSPQCGCVHHVAVGQRTGIVATCECGCEPITLQPRDVVLFTLDFTKFGSAVAGELGFTTAAVEPFTGGRSFRVGFHGTAKSPVVLTFASIEDVLLTEIEMLLVTVATPFVLLVLTDACCTARLDAALRRNFCAAIPLSSTLALEPSGKLKAAMAIDGVLMEFERALVTRGAGLVKTIERIGRDMDAVVKQKHELLQANARLRGMQAEGLFGFTAKIDPDTLRFFFAILAEGDVAKASRTLGLHDSTLRSKVEKWSQQGKAYALLADFVRWRKSIKGRAGIDYAKRLASGTERDVDYPALISDMLEELESFNSDNWPDKCDELAQLLRASLS